MKLKWCPITYKALQAETKRYSKNTKLVLQRTPRKLQMRKQVANVLSYWVLRGQDDQQSTLDITGCKSTAFYTQTTLFLTCLYNPWRGMNSQACLQRTPETYTETYTYFPPIISFRPLFSNSKQIGETDLSIASVSLLGCLAIKPFSFCKIPLPWKLQHQCDFSHGLSEIQRASCMRPLFSSFLSWHFFLGMTSSHYVPSYLVTSLAF